MVTLSRKRKPLPLPDHYDPAHTRMVGHSVRDAYSLMQKAEAWRKIHDIRPAGSDQRKVHLLVIDDQVDFSFPEGSLYVAGSSGTGAMDAQRNLVEFIYQNLDLISEITCTLDTHLPYQIFFPSAHLFEDQGHPPPNTVISAEDYRKGKYRPNPAMARQLGVDPVWLTRQFTYYCEKLEESGKHMLYLWPYHCLLGSEGHRLSGVVEEARLFHSFTRSAANVPEVKGGNPLSERYSIFKEEVTDCFDKRPIPGAQKNTHLIRTLLEADQVLLAGLASSHCVKESIADLLKEISDQDPALARKVYILSDCTAAVVVPNGPDFTEDARRAIESFRQAGMHVVRSKEPMESWS